MGAPDLTPGTIGALEAQAGVGSDHHDRFAFWIAFKGEADPIAAGVAELRRRIADRRFAPADGR